MCKLGESINWKNKADNINCKNKIVNIKKGSRADFEKIETCVCKTNTPEFIFWLDPELSWWKALSKGGIIKQAKIARAI